MTNMIIGVVGFKGSGKDTVGKHLVRKHGFQSTSFAAPLKKSLAALMDWDIKELEGVSDKSRLWRETPDVWWSQQLQKDVTPRSLMQQFGTQMVRRHLHNDFWVIRTKKLMESNPGNWVITDVRFPNEINMIMQMGGTLVRVQRGGDPEWASRAAWINSWPSWIRSCMTWLDPEIKSIHESERAWLGHDMHHVIPNNSTKAHLYDQVDLIVNSLNSSDVTTVK